MFECSTNVREGVPEFNEIPRTSPPKGLGVRGCFLTYPRQGWIKRGRLSKIQIFFKGFNVFFKSFAPLYGNSANCSGFLADKSFFHGNISGR